MMGKAGGMGDKIVASMWPSSVRGRVQSFDCLARGLHKINGSPNQALRLYVTNRGNITNPPLIHCRKAFPPPRKSVAGARVCAEKIYLNTSASGKSKALGKILKIVVLLF